MAKVAKKAVSLSKGSGPGMVATVTTKTPASSVTKVTMGVSRLVNLGNYENVRLDATAEVTVGPDGVEAAWEAAYQQSVGNIEKRLAVAIGRLHKNAQTFEGEGGKQRRERR